MSDPDHSLVALDEAKAVWDRMLETDLQPTGLRVARALAVLGRKVDAETIRRWQRKGWKRDGKSTAQDVAAVIYEAAPLVGAEAGIKLVEAADLIQSVRGKALTRTNYSRFEEGVHAFNRMLTNTTNYVADNVADLARKDMIGTAKVMVACAQGQATNANNFRELAQLGDRLRKDDGMKPSAPLQVEATDIKTGRAVEAVMEPNPLDAQVIDFERAIGLAK